MSDFDTPCGWHSALLGDVLKERTDLARTGDELLSVTNDRGVIFQSQSSKRDTSNPDKSKYRRVCPNDIVYNTMRMWQGVSALSQYTGIVSPAYTVCIPTADVEPRYFAALLRHPTYVAQFHRFAQGLVDDTLNLKYEVFARIPVTYPPLAEQRRIADILYTADAAVQQTEALIAKLKLMRTGLLHDLFTRGLDENGQLRDLVAHPDQFKDSPLGSIPCEWLVSTVESEFNIATGFTLGEQRKPRRSTYPYLRVANVQRGFITLDDIAHIEVKDDELVGRLLEKGDLLVVEGHANPNEIGRCARVMDAEVGLTFQNHLFRLRSTRLLPEFAEAWLNSEWSIEYWRSQCGTSSGLNTINQSMLRRLVTVVPSLREQRSIASVLHAHDARIRAEEAYRDKLKLIKQGLMDDLLTGRVRVPVDEGAPA